MLDTTIRRQLHQFQKIFDSMPYKYSIKKWKENMLYLVNISIGRTTINKYKLNPETGSKFYQISGQKIFNDKY